MLPDKLMRRFPPETRKMLKVIAKSPYYTWLPRMKGGPARASVQIPTNDKDKRAFANMVLLREELAESMDLLVTLRWEKRRARVTFYFPGVVIFVKGKYQPCQSKRKKSMATTVRKRIKTRFPGMNVRRLTVPSSRAPSVKKNGA